MQSVCATLSPLLGFVGLCRWSKPFPWWSRPAFPRYPLWSHMYSPEWHGFGRIGGSLQWWRLRSRCLE
jgi:hypothetical protein